MKKEVLSLSKRYKIRLDAELDKNMMISSETIHKIVKIADIKPTETVLEIGAGFGFLTKELAKKSKKVIAIEIDKRFEPILKKQSKDFKNIDFIFENILKILKNKKIKFDRIVSNLPYAICESLINKLICFDFKTAVLTVPKRFAYILTAKEGDKKFSKLSLIAQNFFNIKVLFEIQKNSFYPEPKTNSVVIKLTPKRKNMFCFLFLRQKNKLKNAIIRALFETEKMTKNEARKRIKTLNLNNKVLEKRVKDLNLSELKEVIKNL